MTNVKGVVFLLCVLFQFSLQAKEVCYEKYGCFSKAWPFNNFWVQLPWKPSKVGTAFHLFTRSNRDESQIIDDNDKIKLMSSNFDATKNTYVIVHGYTENINRRWAVGMKKALLDEEDCNVISVDWSNGARALYGQSAGNTRIVGAQIAELIKFIVSDSPEDTNRFNIIGFSLGAHTAGYAGDYLKTKGMELGRITGLDPAGPYFTDVDKKVKLDKGDAYYVDVIHTDTRAFGTSLTNGHTDFYPNGGSAQRGCNMFDFVCNHARATEYYISSVKGTCPWTAYPCKNYEDYARGECRTCDGKCPSMGFKADETKREGKFYLKTNKKSPFCDEKPWR